MYIYKHIIICISQVGSSKFCPTLTLIDQYALPLTFQLASFIDFLASIIIEFQHLCIDVYIYIYIYLYSFKLLCFNYFYSSLYRRGIGALFPVFKYAYNLSLHILLSHISRFSIGLFPYIIVTIIQHI